MDPRDGMIGIFGGTFDPIHFGHIRPAMQLLRELPLKEIRFIPCHTPPHRPPPEATPEQRWYMLTRVIGRQPGLVADDRELRRPGPSYTVDTLGELRQELGSEAPLALIMGSDAYAGLPQWHRWEDLPALAHIIVMRRPGAGLPAAGRAAELLERNRTGDPHALLDRPHGRILVWDVEPQDISSTGIRACIHAGGQPRYLLPGTVWSYIRREGLYGAVGATS